MLRFLVVLVLFPLLGRGQNQPASLSEDDSLFQLNVLAPPASPGASLLGVSPSEILKPVDPKAFAASIQNATKSFTTLPQSFAVDVAPAKFFTAKKIDYAQFSKNEIPANSWQSWVVSLAYKSDTVLKVKTPQLAVGTKVSILRGYIGSKTGQLLSESTRELNKLMGISNRQEILRLKPVMQLQTQIDSLKKLARERVQNNGIDNEVERLTNLASALGTQLNDTITAYVAKQTDAITSLRHLKQIAKDIKYTRYGFKLDAALGWVFSFPNESFQAGSTNKFGAWLTPAYDWEKGNFSALGIVRYLFNPDNPLADTEGILKGKKVQTIDWGARLVYGGSDQRIAISGEAIYRSIVSKQDPALSVSPSWRVVFNAEYELSANTRLTLSVGKDFDNTVIKQGNVIGFLNLIGAFGGDTVKLR
ncbi:hypothetical protein [Spirosoma koreense]